MANGSVEPPVRAAATPEEGRMKPFVTRLILVPTDLSGPAAHALRYASSLAERLGARLLVIYADPFIPPDDSRPTRPGSSRFRVMR